MLLKQSTSAIIEVGPVLAADGTAYTGMAAADFNLTKNGVTAALSGNTVTHSHEGVYLLTLTTGNTDTLGRIAVTCNKSTYAMAPYRALVKSATTFDAEITNAAGSAGGILYNGTNTGAVIPTVTNTTQLNGSTTVTVGTNNDKTGYSISGTTQTLDALQTAQNTAHGAGSWATATGFSTHSAADVWAVGTRTLTGFGTLVADVATAVWASGSRTLTGFGTLVSQILTAMFVDGETNKLKVNTDHTAEANASVSLSPEDIDSIATDTATAVISSLGNQAIEINSPFALGGALTIITGDSYIASNGTSLTVDLVGRSDLIGLIPHLVGKSGTTFDLTASAVSSGTETMTFSDLDGETTLLLTAGVGGRPAIGEYQIRFLDGSGNKVTESSGLLYVRRGIE